MPDRTVLVVEDDPAVSGLVVELLEDAGFTVLQARLGQQGLRLVEEYTPAVVLVNQMLPDMSGLDVLERLRHGPETRQIPVILISSRVQQLADGASNVDRVLPMPFDIDVLLTQVEQLALLSQGSVA